MYFLDPQQGRRRRAWAGDQFTHLSHEARDAAEMTARDAANRARGLWAETKAALAGSTPDDHTLIERVRSHLGRCVSHPRAITVTADRGKITLSGPILAHEVDNLLDCAQAVPGVAGVENRLEVHDRPGKIPALQGGVPRTGARSEFCQANWSPSVRALAGAIGIALMGNCLAQRDVGSALLGTLGLGLFVRAVTNTGLGEVAAQAIPALRTTPEEIAPLLAAGAAGPGL